jgi:hypothetical protein
LKKRKKNIKMENQEWDIPFDDFLEIVDALEVKKFATAPPMELAVEVDLVAVQGSKSFTRRGVGVNTHAEASPGRTGIGLRELNNRLDLLEESTNIQLQQIHELYGYINGRLERIEKMVAAASKKEIEKPFSRFSK